MGIYKYRAVDINGRIVKGKKIASKDTEFIEDLHDKNLYILDYKVTEDKNIFDKLNYINYKDIGMLLKQLGELLKCGINIEKALDILINEKLKIPIRKSLFSIKTDIEKGKSLSSSINKFTKIYPNFMRQMISVGEKSGKLDEVVLKLSEYYLKQYKIKKKVKGVFTYPIFVFVMIIMITMFITFNIVPKFAENFIKLNKPMPIGIERILQFNNALKSYKLYVILICILVTLRTLYKKGYINNLLEKFTCRGVLGSIYKQVHEISIIQSLSILLSSGIPLVSALDIILNSVDNKTIKNKIIKVISNIKEGMSFADSLRYEKMFNEFFLCMISVGEKIGNIEELIENAIVVKQEDIDSLINKLIKSIEPVTILVLGLIVTFIMINILFPMISTMDSII
ncbi:MULTISPECIES: type II secretion system F family protein [Clostridium]|uniref:Probable pilin biogenesis protein, putative n=1 Tax=Clostridium novyi (strain NT) TaxID=386415 RepID=A0Q078_CLONN|nr:MULTISPECIES: type II secretion system F family protein [Clostridium]ABK61710.1 probable pilin biogenesis protein, putative [Clostridium novyi NT]KEH84861.1 pilus assembly protein [Clostridium novyi A str. 4540]KEH85068.1 pilus assembly protein [Clostridium novyi A str. BKT29909]KEH85488.1 pilus assembly protein [Clostridium novyi A str. NCTC 538]KEH90321.1 pilus assembly protein [Clostridium novyi A str. GD211209]